MPSYRALFAKLPLGGASGRDGLLLGGEITAGIGLVAIGPGVYFIATSGSKTEIYSDRGLEEALRIAPSPSPGVGLGTSF